MYRSSVRSDRRKAIGSSCHASFRRLSLISGLFSAIVFGAEPPLAIPAERLMLGGVETFVAWPKVPASDSASSQWGRPKAGVVFFHGCTNRAQDWFSKPEEVRFLKAVQRRGLAFLAFTTPRHSGNLCWPSPDGEGDRDFHFVVEATKKALAEVVSERLPRGGEGDVGLPLILVGGSSGGTFASRLPSLWARGGGRALDGVAWIAGLLSVVSPTSLVRRGVADGPPPSIQHPPTAFAYMPRDVSFASERAVTAAMERLDAVGVQVKAWAVGPRPFLQRDLAAQLREVGLTIEDGAAGRFCEALESLGLLGDGGEVMEDPRRFPWHRAAWHLAPEGRHRDLSADPERELRARAVEELLNRAYAQHEFAAADIADEVLDWLLVQGGDDETIAALASAGTLSGEL